jgi:hypothetical protein
MDAMKSPRRYLVRAALLVFVLLVGAMVLAVSNSCYLRYIFSWDHASFGLPGNAVIVTYWRKGVHPFAAEYSRGVTFSGNGGGTQFRPLVIDTGQGTRINVYSIHHKGRRFVRLEDETAEHLLDIDKGEVYVIAHSDSEPYIARLDRENPEFGYRSPTVPLTVDDRPAFRLKFLVPDAHGQYVGVLDGPPCRLRFIPRAQREEEPIAHGAL